MIRLCRRFMANLSVVTGPNELCEVKINGSNGVNNVKALKRINLPRNIENAAREYILSSALYREGNLTKLTKIVVKCKERNELSSRSAAFAVALAIKLEQWKDAHSLLSYVTISPPGLKRSLYICLLAKEGYLDEALDQLEGCLNDDDIHFHTENACISEEALNQLYSCIKCKNDTTKQMRRFRALQRVITAYGRRSVKTIDEMLNSPLNIDNDVSNTFAEWDIKLSDKVIEQIPHFLMVN